MKFKFKRYNVIFERKEYFIYIPEYVDSYFNYIFDGDGYSYIYGDRKAIKQLIACFALLAWNPYAVIYLPTKHNKVPSSVLECDYPNLDMVFHTNKTVFKCSDWKEIRKRLKTQKSITYKFELDIERMKSYFGKDVEHFKNTDYGDVSKKAGADLQVANDTLFMSFPQIRYKMATLELYDYFFIAFNDPETFYGYLSGSCWTNEIWQYFSYFEYERKMDNYSRPPLTLCIDCYDIGIVNRFKKEKEFMVQR